MSLSNKYPRFIINYQESIIKNENFNKHEFGTQNIGERNYTYYLKSI